MKKTQVSQEAYDKLHEAFGKSIIPFEVPIVENGECVLVLLTSFVMTAFEVL